MNRVGLVVLALVLALAKAARAADTKAVAEVEAHDKAFLTAYENGETKKMKTEIAKAVSLGEKGGLGADPGKSARSLGAGSCAFAGRRCRARRAREDDAAAPNHRAPPQRRAKHRRHADDLQ